MQANRIIQFIKEEDSFGIESLGELAELIEEFPYFQTAYLLYLLKLKELRDSRFYSQLRKTACYMGDRTQMFYRIEKDFSDFLRKEKEDKKEKESGASFSLIDSFLEKKYESQEQGTVSEALAIDLLQRDYLSYPLSEESAGKEIDNNNEETDIFIPPLKYQSAIDKFLEEDEKSPFKIEIQNAEIKDDEAFPDLDTVTEDSFFSETLAKIYLKQKKYEKALEIIRKLNLIYPEKNRYFADQIRFLEKLIINTKK